MKTLLTLSIILTCSLFGKSQNALFVGFDHNYASVEETLRGFERARFHTNVPNKKIVVEYNRAIITYLFNQGQLYKIEMNKRFDTKRQGKEAFDGCLKYFQTISARQLDYSRCPKSITCISSKMGTVYQLRLVPGDESTSAFELQLSTNDPFFTPPHEWENYDHQVAREDQSTLEYIEEELENLYKYKRFL